MERLRLKRIWVILTVLLCITGLVKIRGIGMKTAEASAPTSAEETTTEADASSGTYKIWFITSSSESGSGDVDFQDTDGLSTVQWNMKSPGSTGFAVPNTGVVTARLSISGDTPTDFTGVVDELRWDYSVYDASNADAIIGIEDRNPAAGGIVTEKALLVSPKAAGLVSVTFSVKGYRNGAEIINVARTIVIGSPLQLYDSAGVSPVNYSVFDKNTRSATIYANNAAISACDIFWFYVDAHGNYVPTSPAFIDLPAPTYLETDSLPRVSNIIESISERLNNSTVAPNNITVWPYTVTMNQTGGFTRLVGRIYLDGQSTAREYVEATYDIMYAAEFKDGLETTEDNFTGLVLNYGDTRALNVLANDSNSSLGWVSYKERNSVLDGQKEDAVVHINANGITARNYGVVTLEATAIYKNWERFNLVGDNVTDTLEVKVRPDVLKGNESKEIIDQVEVISVGGAISLSTNVVGDEYSYTWEHLVQTDTTGAEIYETILPTTTTPVFGVGSFISSTNGYSGITIEGIASGQTKMRCTVKKGTNEIIMKKTFTIRVVDTMTLSETRKSIAVGGGFDIEAYVSGTNGSRVTWSVAEGYEDYVVIESTGATTATVTGRADTKGAYVQCKATMEMNGTTTSATFYVMVVPSINGAHIVATPSNVISVSGSTNLNLVLDTEGTSFTRDQIRWVVKDANGVDASTIISKTDSTSNILQTTITGLAVGEAYVAVVTNDTAQTEIAIITIRVVSEVTGLALSENEVTGYLPGTHELLVTTLPEGYTDSSGVGIEWTSSNPNIATVAADPTDPLKGIVTYVNIGTVRITANVAGLPAVADVCTFIIENPITEIALDQTSIQVKVGENVTLTPTLSPENATNTSIVWESFDTSVATVSQTGVVTGVAAGGTVVTATTSNGLTVQCVVTVLTPIESISLNYSTITVKKGTVFFLSANVLPLNAYDRTVTWSSSDEGIAFVAADGTVTANSTGTCTITATSNDDNTITATCTVVVTESVSGIMLNYREKTIDPGETFVLTATVLPSDAVNKAVTFTSSNPAAATVDANGLVTGVAGGSTIIVVRTADRGLIATCTVTVQQDITGITFEMTDMYLPIGEDAKINYTLTPATATIKDLTWTSSNPAVAIVDSQGYVHGVSLGEVVITATSRDGTEISATCNVKVITPVTKITLSETALTLMEGEQHQLSYSVTPANATVGDMNWTSSNVAVATINSLGMVTAVSAGETRIRIEAADGSGSYAECIVVVTPYIPITSIRLNSTETTMIVGDSRTLTDRTYPENTTESAVWRSSDTSIASVDSSGNVRAVGAGTCTISKLGVRSGVEGTCVVHVLGLTASDITLEVYDTFDLYLDDPEADIVWFSRDKRTATVSNAGLVTARRAGTTYIVADLNGKLVSCRVTVTDLRKPQNEEATTVPEEAATGAQQ